MKKLLVLLMAFILTLALVGCGNTQSQNDYDVRLFTQHKYYSNFTSDVIICVFVDEPIWDTYYATYGDVYEYEFYGDDVDFINTTFQGTLEIAFKSGERTVIYGYIAIHFDN